MSFGGCFWALGFCVDWRNKTCFGKTATTAKVKIGPLWSKIKKLSKKMFLWPKKSFSPETCVHWIKLFGQKTPNIRYGPFPMRQISMNYEHWGSFLLNLCFSFWKLFRRSPDSSHESIWRSSKTEQWASGWVCSSYGVDDQLHPIRSSLWRKFFSGIFTR